MASLDTQLSEMMRHLSQVIPKGESQENITEIGAQVFDNHLKQATKNKHYHDGKTRAKGSKNRKVKHLADSIIVQKGDIDGVHNGSSTVAFENAKASGVDHGRIARFINDGTIKMKGDHFIDDAREESQTGVFKAMEAEYHKGLGNNG